MKKKKAQAWGIDLMIAVIIFSVGILVLYVYAFNESDQSGETFENLFYDGKIIFNYVLSEGYPANWTESNVIQIGILTNNKIDLIKLATFFTLAQNDYERTKRLFNTKYDYFFYIEGSNWNIGKPGVDKSNITATNLVKITRFSILNNKPATIYLYIWEE